MGIEQYANDATTTLASTLNSGATSISLTSGANFPTGPHRVRIQSEIILIASRSSNTLTVASGGRGAEGTSDVQHAAGQTVEAVLTRRGLFSAPGVFDVRAYGAVGNGSTDDTAAIQAAIDAAEADGGGTVYIPGGGWKIAQNGGLTIGANGITIKGAGTAYQGGSATTLYFDGTTGSVFSNASTSSTRWDTTIRDLTIYSESLTTGALILVQNFHRFHGINLHLQCNWATGGSCVRIQGAGAWSTYFSFWDKCVFEGGDYCVLIDGEGQANGHHFTNFTMRGGGGTSPSGFVSIPTTYSQGGYRLTGGSIEGLDGTYGAIHFGSTGTAATTDSHVMGVNVESSNGSIEFGQNSWYNHVLSFVADNASGNPAFYSDAERRMNYIAYGEVNDSVENQPMSMNGGLSRPWGLKLPLTMEWTAENGRTYYDVATHRLYIYDGAGWRYIATTT